MKKQKVLFVTPSFQSFVKQDIQILSKYFDLTINAQNWKEKERAPFLLIYQFLLLLLQVPKVDFVWVHFGGYWSFLPALLGKITGKPVFIVLHGTDCASIPELHYGSLRIPLLRWFIKKSYQWASCLLPVSDSLINSKQEFGPGEKVFNNGFLHHFQGLKTPYKVIPNGFDQHFWSLEKNTTRDSNSFLSVLSKDQFILKGGDLILQLAKRLPECSFRIAGMEIPELKEPIPNNLSFLGKLSAKDLREEYRKASIYLQLSAFEGFGCALCEAMLCGCFPVGSNVNHIPTIIGKSGRVITKRDLSILEKCINDLFEKDIDDQTREAIRQSIEERFNLDVREMLILSTLKSYL